MTANLRVENFGKHLSLVDKLVNFLEKEIIEGQLKPGERLIETRLSKALGISRSPIREALRILEREGFVTVSPRRGITVSEFTNKDIDDVYKIRAPLEALAAELATANLTDENITELESIYLDMKKAAEKKDLKKYFQFSQEFHEKMLKATDNERLIKILNNFRKQILRFRFFGLSFPERIDGSLQNHRKLLDFFRSRDVERAGNLRYEVVENSRNFLKQKLSNNRILSDRLKEKN